MSLQDARLPSLRDKIESQNDSPPVEEVEVKTKKVDKKVKKVDKKVKKKK